MSICYDLLFVFDCIASGCCIRTKVAAKGPEKLCQICSKHDSMKIRFLSLYAEDADGKNSRKVVCSNGFIFRRSGWET